MPAMSSPSRSAASSALVLKNSINGRTPKRFAALARCFSALLSILPSIIVSTSGIFFSKAIYSAFPIVILFQHNGPQQRHRATGVIHKQRGLAGSAGCGGWAIFFCSLVHLCRADLDCATTAVTFVVNR